jgi:hypothetical protein
LPPRAAHAHAPRFLCVARRAARARGAEAMALPPGGAMAEDAFAAHRRTAHRVASLVAGGVAAPLVCAPLDVLRTRMQGTCSRAHVLPLPTGCDAVHCLNCASQTLAQRATA